MADATIQSIHMENISDDMTNKNSFHYNEHIYQNARSPSEYKRPLGELNDGSLYEQTTWTLEVGIVDSERDIPMKLTVSDDNLIGDIMLKIIRQNSDPHDWSDYALWWPGKQRWLTETQQSLRDARVQADAGPILFTPMHRLVQIQLPDLVVYSALVDFSVSCFRAVAELCHMLRIKNPEELSFCQFVLAKDQARQLVEQARVKTYIPSNCRHRNHRKTSNGKSNGKIPQDSRKSRTTSNGSSNDSILGGSATTPIHGVVPSGTLLRGGTLARTPQHTSTLRTNFTAFSTMQENASPLHVNTPGSPVSSPFSEFSSVGFSTMAANATFSSTAGNGFSSRTPDRHLVWTPNCSLKDGLNRMPKTKSYVEKSEFNAAWLDSSVSLLEQGVCEGDVLCLRYKFITPTTLSTLANAVASFEPSPGLDLIDHLTPAAVRLNQIFNQAKWSILSEEVKCLSDDQLFVLAALQHKSQSHPACSFKMFDDSTGNGGGDSGYPMSPSSNPDTVDRSVIRKPKLGSNGRRGLNSPGAFSGSSLPDRKITEDDVQALLDSLTNRLQNGGAMASLNNNSAFEKSPTRSTPNVTISSTTSPTPHPYNPQTTETAPLLQAYLQFSRPRRKLASLTLKKWKPFWFNLDGESLVMSAFKSRDDWLHSREPLLVLGLPGCSIVHPEPVSSKRFVLRIEVPMVTNSFDTSLQSNTTTQSSSAEAWLLKFDSDSQFAEWSSALKLASRSVRPVGPEFESEKETTLGVLKLQRSDDGSGGGGVHSVSPASLLGSGDEPDSNANQRDPRQHNSSIEYPCVKVDGDMAQDLVPMSLTKRFSAKAIADKINRAVGQLDAGMSPTDAKVAYLQSWIRIQDAGVAFFVVAVEGSKGPIKTINSTSPGEAQLHGNGELMGICSDRIMRLDPTTGRPTRSWLLKHVKSWNVNWEIKQMCLKIAEPTTNGPGTGAIKSSKRHVLEQELVLVPKSCSLKTLHEFIGGYMFLAIRDAPNTMNKPNIDEKLFQELTGGWSKH